MANTIIIEARNGSIPDELYAIAKNEGVDVNKLRTEVAKGRIIIPRNIRRVDKVKLIGIGEGLTTKVNTNIGTSGTVFNINMEIEKAKNALKYGSDTIMDLSIGGDLDKNRRILLKEAEPLPFGTVPTYQAWIDGVKKFNGINISSDWFLKVVEKQLMDGVDFMTIHAGISRDLAFKSVKSSRIMPTVSRGGAMLTAWMLENNEENPYIKNWNYLLELFQEYDTVISLGDALRPGTIADACDELQESELINNVRLAKKAIEEGVQVMIEGPGHMSMDKIITDVRLMKSLSGGIPYYVLGPLAVDTAIGYDHIAAAIGAAIASASGTDLICYLTPAEHLSLPNPDQVKEGIIAAKIATHAGDIVKLGYKAAKEDIELSVYRAHLNWSEQFKYAPDKNKAIKIYSQYGQKISSCTMCGQYCVFLVLDKYLKDRKKPNINELINRFTTNKLDPI